MHSRLRPCNKRIPYFRQQTERTAPCMPPSTHQVELMTYTGEQLDDVGQWNAQAQYGQQSKTFLLIVVTGDGLSLLGRNWQKHLCLDWKKIGKIRARQDQQTSDSLLTKDTAIFLNKLWMIQPFKPTFRVKENTTFKFSKECPYPCNQGSY